MALTVVQTAISAGGAYTATFSSPVTAGNTLVYVVSGYGTGTSPTSSAPTIGGVTPSGTTQLYPESKANELYGSMWVLPNIPGGSTAAAITVTNYGTNSVNGLICLEVSGVGSIGPVSSAIYSTTATSFSSGSITTTQSALLIGQADTTQGITGPTGWTALHVTSADNGNAYYESVSSAGSYALTATTANAANAVMGIVALYPVPAAPFAPVQPQPNFVHSEIDVRAELQLNGAWTDISSYIFQDTSSIQRGHQDESTTTSPAQFTATLNNADGRFSPGNPTGPYYGYLGLNTPIRVSLPYGESYLRVLGGNGQAADGPYTLNMLPPGGSNWYSDMAQGVDLRIDMEPDNWFAVGEIFASCYDGGTDNNRTWMMGLDNEGGLVFSYSPDGTSTNLRSATAALPGNWNPKQRMCIRIQWVASTGAVTFYTAPAGTLASGTWTTLYSTTITSGTGYTNVSTTPISIGGMANTGSYGSFSNFHGKIFGFQLLANGGGSQANLDLTTQTPMTTGSVNDSGGNTWTLTGGSSGIEISNRDYRFHGYVAAWPVTWNPVGANARTTITASTILRRVSQGNVPAVSPMYRACTTLTGFGIAPWAYWPCEDGADATQVASAIGGPPMTFSATPLTMSSNSTFACSAPIPVFTAGSQLVGPVPNYPIEPYGTAGADAMVSFLLLVPSSGDTNNGKICTIHFAGGSMARLDLVYSTGGTLTMQAYGPDNATMIWSQAAAFAINGQAVRFFISLQQTSATQYTPSFWEAFPGNQDAAGYTAPVQTGTVGRVTRVTMNNGGLLSGTAVGHVMVQSVITSVYNLSQPLQAWAGESAGSRFKRLCGEQGYTFRSIGRIVGDTTSMGPQTIESIDNLLQECVDADNAYWVEPRDVLGAFCFRTRVSVGNQASAFTLDYNQDLISTGLAPTQDDQSVFNYITATSQNSGSSATQILQDSSPMSIQAIGTYDEELTINATDAVLNDIAGWYLHTSTVNEPRYPAVPVDLVNTAVAPLATSVLHAEIGDTISVGNLPTWMPPGTINQVVLGLTENLSRDQLNQSFNCRPASCWNIIYNDDVVYGRVDSGDSVLGNALNAPLVPTLISNSSSTWTSYQGTVTDSPLPSSIASSNLPDTWALYTTNGGTYGNAGPTARAAVTPGTIYITQALVYMPAGGTVSMGIQTYNSGTYVTDSEVASFTIPAGVVTPVNAAYTIPASGVNQATPRLYFPAAPSGQVYVAAMTITQASTASTTVTNLRVIEGDGALWSTASGDYPVDISVGGERITVLGTTAAEWGQVSTVDGTFESGLASWFTQNATATQSSTAYAGSYSAEVAYSGSGTYFDILSLPLTPVNSGAQYQVNCYIRIAPSSFAVAALIGWFDVNGKYLSTSTASAFTPAATYTWEPYVSSTLVAPSNAAYCQFGVGVPTAASGLYFYVDNIFLQAYSQRMNVVRGVNGVVKPQAVGTPIALATPPILSY